MPQDDDDDGEGSYEDMMIPEEPEDLEEVVEEEGQQALPRRRSSEQQPPSAQASERSVSGVAADEPSRRTQVKDLLHALDSHIKRSSLSLREFFDMFDWNRDGRLQTQELKAFVTALIGKTSEREFRYAQVGQDPYAHVHTVCTPSVVYVCSHIDEGKFVQIPYVM